MQHALFVISILNADSAGTTAMLRHWCPEQLNAKPLVKWKDLLSGQWKGPDPLLTSGRGCACIFPQDADSPIWVPDRPGLWRALAHPAHQAALASAPPASPRTLLAAPPRPRAKKFVQQVRAREESAPAKCRPDQRGAGQQGRQDKHRDPGETDRAAVA